MSYAAPDSPLGVILLEQSNVIHDIHSTSIHVCQRTFNPMVLEKMHNISIYISLRSLNMLKANVFSLRPEKI